MFEIKFVRQHLSTIEEMLANRCEKIDLIAFSENDSGRRAVLSEIEELKA